MSDKSHHPDASKPTNVDQGFNHPAPISAGAPPGPQTYSRLNPPAEPGELAIQMSKAQWQRRSFEFAPQYGPAFLTCLVVQVALFFLTALVLDGGQLNRFCFLTITCQWIGNFVILGRRPASPTTMDLLFIRYGMVPLLFVTPFIADGVWSVIGHSTLNGLQRWGVLPLK